jgi:hypothetical protein
MRLMVKVGVLKVSSGQHHSLRLFFTNCAHTPRTAHLKTKAKAAPSIVFLSLFGWLRETLYSNFNSTPKIKKISTGRVHAVQGVDQILIRPGRNRRKITEKSEVYSL